ncbi:cellulose biosynthesis cyclic di-GMP-binding regulatory protein BcsB [Caproicibacter fermentans]|uniref:Cellulose biosynthesis cyclic di-GMP-binding regulatory protein BcsB n=1 Tax=Caproicibacter fermentans TaxID=2576756 RepID=A0A7G8TES9_9FIRM|nr:cellulose biosynthesis cyclic di-GMP-binding regulatory protein BcsB [Caproicibacter fermentans]QNK42120.1 cellulose biosynthesis cyclic di-GMP-binding regulatory protein BcsB [Caproicibacter fermentans]
MHKVKKPYPAQLLVILSLLVSLLYTELPVTCFAAGAGQTTSSAALNETQRQQKEEGDRLTAEADAAKQKADELVLEGKLNRLNSDSADIQLFSQTVHLSMPRNTASYTFRIPNGTVLQDGCYLNLDLHISSTLLENRSSITIAVNGTNLDTKWILSVVKNQASWWKIPVPVSLLKTDGSYNTLTITTAQRSIEGDCADIDNPSNWVRFDPDSFLHLAISRYAEPNLGNLYSYYYDNLDDGFSLKNEFVLPSNPKTTDITYMLKAASAIGCSSRWKNLLDFKVSKSEPADPNIKNKIYLGILQNWSGNANLTLPGALAENEGFLSVKGENALITGRDEAGLKKAVDFFSAPAYLNQIGGKSLTVKSAVSDISAGIKPNDSGYYTFQDFGYDDVNLAGAFHQTTTMNFMQPSDVSSGAASYVNIKFRHSKALMPDSSLLSVYINDTACGSVKLNSSNADSGNIKVGIPAEALKQETISVKIDVYNYLGKIDCSKDWYDTAWTVINKDSELYFEPGSAGVTPTLLNFPSFPTFSADNTADVMVSMPDDSSPDNLTVMSLLSVRVGQKTGQTFDYSLCSSAAKITEEDKKKNMIFIGSNDKVSLPEEVSAALGVVPAQDGAFHIANGLTLTAETLQNKIVFQVIRSPWNFYKKIYVITYDKGMEKNLQDFLSDSSRINKLSDELSVVDAQNHVTGYTIGAGAGESQKKVPLSWERIKYLIEKYTGIPVWAAGLILVLILLCLYLLIQAKRNKKRFEQNAEKIRLSMEGNSRAAEEPDESDFGASYGGPDQDSREDGAAAELPSAAETPESPIKKNGPAHFKDDHR